MKRKKTRGLLLNDRYLLGAPVGRGGMSTVYRAKDVKTGDTVAVKMFKRQLKAQPELLARFRAEAQTLSGLTLPGVVRLRGFSLREDQPYLVLEFLPGATLAELFDNGYTLPLDWHTAAQLVAWLLQTLRALHAKGVVHRDVKPQNIMVSNEGRFTLIDFGNAAPTGSTQFANSTHAIGSVYYVSPQQARCLPPDPRDDVYATGIVLYQLLTGCLPFQGPTPRDTAQLHQTATPAPLADHVPGLPDGLQDIVDRALAKQADWRYPTAGAMLQDLQDLLVDPALRFAAQPPAAPAHGLRGLWDRARSLLHTAPNSEDDDEDGEPL